MNNFWRVGKTVSIVLVRQIKPFFFVCLFPFIFSSISLLAQRTFIRVHLFLYCYCVRFSHNAYVLQLSQIYFKTQRSENFSFILSLIVSVYVCVSVVYSNSHFNVSCFYALQRIDKCHWNEFCCRVIILIQICFFVFFLFPSNGFLFICWTW